MDNGSNRLDDHGDLRKIGNSSPRYHYGINFSANWNGIDFAVFFQGVGKRDWYPAGESGLFWGQYDRPYGYSLPWQNADRWSEDNPNAYWPRLRGSLAVSGRGTLRAANDRYLQKARYCRLKNITVQAWSPFQYGMFEGIFIGSEKYPKLNEVLNRLAEKYNTTPNGIAVAWILRHPAGIQTIVGTMNEKRLSDVAKAADIVLTREEWYELYLAAGKMLP